MGSFESFLKKSKKGGNFVKVGNGESVVVTIDCTPSDLESKESRFGGEVIEVPVLDENGKKKVWTVKLTQRKIVAALAEMQEGDEVKIGKTEPTGDQEHGRLYAKLVSGTSKKKSSDDEEEEETDKDEEEETPKKKKKVVEEDEEETEDDEEEDEKPKKKSKKPSDEEDEETEEDDEDETPKKKKKSKKSDDEVDPDDIDF